MTNSKCPNYHHFCGVCSCRWECITPNCSAPVKTLCPWDEAHRNGVQGKPNVQHYHNGPPCDVCQAYKKGTERRAK